MMRVLSDVYPPEIKPAREGWYLVHYIETNLWAWCWWGGRWYASPTRRFPLADRSWQGLAFDPAGAFRYETWMPKYPGTFNGDFVAGVFLPGAKCC